MGKKKRHHYIPQFYLREFIDPSNLPYLWVYEKGCVEIKSVSAKDAGVEKDYHSFPNSDGQKDTESIENAFQKIEYATACVFERIKAQENLSEEERDTFATFLSLMLTRVPNYRKNVERVMGELLKHIAMMDASNIDWLRGNIEMYEKVTGEPLGMSPEEFQKTILEEGHGVSASPTFSLQMMSVNLSGVFLDKTWFYIKATDRVKFLTSDNPLFYHDPTRNRDSDWSVGLADENTEVTFPISRDLALVATRRKGVRPGYIPVSHQVVKDINRRTVISAQRFVYSSEKSEALNRLVQKYMNSSPKMGVGWPQPKV